MSKNKKIHIVFLIVLLVLSPFFYFSDFGYGWLRGFGLAMGISTLLRLILGFLGIVKFWD